MCVYLMDRILIWCGELGIGTSSRPDKSQKVHDAMRST